MYRHRFDLNLWFADFELGSPNHSTNMLPHRDEEATCKTDNFIDYCSLGYFCSKNNNMATTADVLTLITISLNRVHGHILCMTFSNERVQQKVSHISYTPIESIVYYSNFRMTVENAYVITWLLSFIGLKISGRRFDQWGAKPNPIALCTRDFSRAFSKIQAIARNSDLFITLFAPVLIGWSNYLYFSTLFAVH